MKDNDIKQETAMARRSEDLLPAEMFRPFDLMPGFTPFTMMRRFTDDMERFFENFAGFDLMPKLEMPFDMPKLKKFQKTMWAPQIEVKEEKGQFMVKADLPGLKKEDIDIELTENALVISGERNQETKKEDEAFFRSERNYGSFYRSIPLPRGFNAEKAHAAFHNGVLEVTVPVPAREIKARKLPITEKAEKAPKAHAKAA